MSEENLEIVRRLYDAVARRDEEAVLALYDPEVEFDPSRSPFASLIGGRRLYRGHEGVRSFFRERSEALENVEDAYEELIDAGDHVVLVGSVRARGRASGIEVEPARAAGVFTIREGRIARVVWLATREEALEAVGLKEANGSLGTIELARQLIAALNRRDLSMLTSRADPDVEWHSFFAQLGEGGVYRGHDGARRWLRDLDDAWEIVRAEVDDEIAVGDVAVLTGRIHYRGKGSGIETETPAGWMLKFRDGKVTLFRAFRDPEQALEAVGLPKSEFSRQAPR
jgi:ketosteroid isomerase-like protein